MITTTMAQLICLAIGCLFGIGIGIGITRYFTHEALKHRVYKDRNDYFRLDGKFVQIPKETYTEMKQKNPNLSKVFMTTKIGSITAFLTDVNFHEVSEETFREWANGDISSHDTLNMLAVKHNLSKDEIKLFL